VSRRERRAVRTPRSGASLTYAKVTGVVLLLVLLAAGCTDEPSTPAEVKEAALDWVAEGPSRALQGGERDGVALTYGAGGETGQLHYLGDPREPVIPDNLVWDADTYYLDLEGWSMGFLRADALAVGLCGDLAAGPRGVRRRSGHRLELPLLRRGHDQGPSGGREDRPQSHR